MSPSNARAGLQQIWSKPGKWENKLNWRIKNGVGLFTEICERNPSGKAACPSTPLQCHTSGTETDLGYGGPCSQLQVAITHLKLHLPSKRPGHSFLRLWWPLERYFNKHALCISKRYSRQTLDKFHIFIMVPVLKINISFTHLFTASGLLWHCNPTDSSRQNSEQEPSPSLLLSRTQDRGGCLAGELTLSQVSPAFTCPDKPGRNNTTESPKMREERITFKETRAMARAAWQSEEEESTAFPTCHG